MPSDSVNLVITSPPYFQQRNYTGDDPAEIGTEGTLDAYLGRLADVFAECVRVTRPTGSLVFNMGDKYVDGHLLLVPYRFAILVAARTGVRLVNNVTWTKPNPTPKPSRRRLTCATEPFFHFAKTADYFYDLSSLDTDRSVERAGGGIGKGYLDAINRSPLTEEQKSQARKELAEAVEAVRRGEMIGFRMKIMGVHALPFGGQPGGRLTQMKTKGFTIIRMPGRQMHRDVFECPVETVRGNKHPAVFPVELVEKFVKLTTRPDDIVLDPFMGSGTTARACRTTGRNYVGFDLSAEYVQQSTLGISEA
jgi:site-specific DNA-methyltransferase (adenine-specific)